jgi:hypothetical protein
MIIELGTEKGKSEKRIYFAGWFPETWRTACIAINFYQDTLQLSDHCPITYVLEGDRVIAGVVVASIADCLDTPSATSYADCSELDKLYPPLLMQ